MKGFLLTLIWLVSSIFVAILSFIVAFMTLGAILGSVRPDASHILACLVFGVAVSSVIVFILKRKTRYFATAN